MSSDEPTTPREPESVYSDESQAGGTTSDSRESTDITSLFTPHPQRRRSGENDDPHSAVRRTRAATDESITGEETAHVDVTGATASDRVVVSDQDRAAAVVDVFGDADCRRLLAELADECKSVRELSDASEVPLSTAYRKLTKLSDAGLVNEGTRVTSDGRPPRIYTGVASAASVSVTPNGELEVVLLRPEESHAD